MYIYSFPFEPGGFVLFVKWFSTSTQSYQKTLTRIRSIKIFAVQYMYVFQIISVPPNTTQYIITLQIFEDVLFNHTMWKFETSNLKELPHVLPLQYERFRVCVCRHTMSVTDHLHTNRCPFCTIGAQYFSWVSTEYIHTYRDGAFVLYVLILNGEMYDCGGVQHCFENSLKVEAAYSPSVPMKGRRWGQEGSGFQRLLNDYRPHSRRSCGRTAIYYIGEVV